MRRATNLLVYILLTVGGCASIERVSGNFPYGREASNPDLGAGWTVEQESFHEIQEALASYAVTFRRANQEGLSGLFLVDQLIVYSFAQQAEDSVDALTTKYVPKGSGFTAGIHFEPAHSADTVADGCRTIMIEAVPYLSGSDSQQHENLVLYACGMMDGDALVPPEYEALLTTLDPRLNTLMASSSQ